MEGVICPWHWEEKPISFDSKLDFEIALRDVLGQNPIYFYLIQGIGDIMIEVKFS